MVILLAVVIVRRPLKLHPPQIATPTGQGKAGVCVPPGFMGDGLFKKR